MATLYDVQVSERDSWGIPRLRTWVTTGSKRRAYRAVADIANLSRSRRLCRVLENGRVLSDREIKDLDR